MQQQQQQQQQRASEARARFETDPLAFLRSEQWAILSAERSERSAAANATASAMLRARLERDYGPENVLDVAGVWQGAREHSFLVLGMPDAAARAAGHWYLQDAVLTSGGLFDTTSADGALIAPLASIELGPGPEGHSEIPMPGGLFTFHGRLAA